MSVRAQPGRRPGGEDRGANEKRQALSKGWEVSTRRPPAQRGPQWTLGKPLIFAGDARIPRTLAGREGPGPRLRSLDPHLNRQRFWVLLEVSSGSRGQGRRAGGRGSSVF